MLCGSHQHSSMEHRQEPVLELIKIVLKKYQSKFEIIVRIPCFGINQAKAHRNRPNLYVFQLEARKMIGHQQCHSEDDFDGRQTERKYQIIAFHFVFFATQSNSIGFRTFKITSIACIARFGSALCWLR